MDCNLSLCRNARLDKQQRRPIYVEDFNRDKAIMSISIRRQVEHSCRECPLRLSAQRWRLYGQIISAAQGQGIGFAIGGGLALGVYTGAWRDTKDIDLYVRPK